MILKKYNLFFDLNCLIHPCCRNETNEDLMFIKIRDYIDKIINLVNPEFTYIAIDGVCPRAKMQQQRKKEDINQVKKTKFGIQMLFRLVQNL